MNFLGRLSLLHGEFVFESFNFGDEGKLSVLEGRLLISFFSDKMLNFRVLFVDDPLFSVDFFEQKPDFSLMLFFQAGSSLDMNVAVLLLNVFDLGFVHLFKFEDSLSQGIVFRNEIFDFALISILQVSVFLELRFELCVSVGIGGFEF